jgi:hypothetical protein
VADRSFRIDGSGHQIDDPFVLCGNNGRSRLTIRKLAGDGGSAPSYIGAYWIY